MKYRLQKKIPQWFIWWDWQCCLWSLFLCRRKWPLFWPLFLIELLFWLKIYLAKVVLIFKAYGCHFKVLKTQYQRVGLCQSKKLFCKIFLEHQKQQILVNPLYKAKKNFFKICLVGTLNLCLRVPEKKQKTRDESDPSRLPKNCKI